MGRTNYVLTEHVNSIGGRGSEVFAEPFQRLSPRVFREGSDETVEHVGALGRDAVGHCFLHAIQRYATGSSTPATV